MKNSLAMPMWTIEVYKYLLLLYNTNQIAIKLSGYDTVGNTFVIENLFIDISQNICKLIPYYMNRKDRKIHLSDKTEGIFCFNNDLLYLKDDYKKLFDKNYDTLFNIKTIRSKSEHDMHKIKFRSCYSGTMSLPEIRFNINEEFLNTKTEDIIKIIICLNILFDKIRNDLINIAFQCHKEDADYIETFSNFSFLTFNDIFNSAILKNIGRIMRDL